ncbi:EAL domain-containing protein [Halothiobacillus sp. DCM-1]|uniref:EAL domain-containing protein n=1 Tax=Halothiobacillus sp. DCM-1 TaxID=3112558 RepID=UPI00324FAB00
MDTRISLPRLPYLRISLKWLLLAPIILLIGWVAGNEWSEYQELKAQVQRNATQSGEAFAQLIRTRLDNQYQGMAFLAGLIAEIPAGATPDARLTEIMTRYTQLNPNLTQVNLIGSDGIRRLWTLQTHDNPPLVPPQEYTAVAGAPGWLLGQDISSDKTGVSGAIRVLTLRYRFLRAGAPCYLSAPSDLRQLLAYHPDEPLPYTFIVRDTRDGSLVGVWQDESVSFTAPTGATETTLIDLPLEHYPFTLAVQVETSHLASAYFQNARIRWLIYLTLLLLLAFAARALAVQMRARATALRQTARLAQFNAMMAEANEAIRQCASEPELLTILCRLAVEAGGMALAHIIQPDETGWFQILASAGATGYLDGLRLSIDEARPEGRGSAGRAWREGKVFFNQNFSTNPDLVLWAERAQQHGLAASASVPIRKNGTMWGIFSVYHTQANIFDEPMRQAMLTLAEQIGFGLEWLDEHLLEQKTSQMQHTLLNNTLLNNTLAGIALVRDRRFIEVNPRLAEMLGFASPVELIGRPTRTIYADAAQFDRVAALYPALIVHGSAQLEDLILRRQDGLILYADIAGSLIDHNRPDTTVWTLQDVTRRHTLEAELRELAEFQRTLFEANAAALLLTDDDGQILKANPAFCQLTGYRCTELAGQSATLLTPDNAPPFVLRLPDAPAGQDPLRHRLHRTQAIRHRAGHTVMVEVLGAALLVPQHGHGVLWSLIDITELHEAQRAVTHQATHDALTGLLNRRGLESQLPKAIARTRRRGNMLAVGMLDLDDFKPVNDTWGHPAGDALLIALAQRLQERLRTEDILARLGGDEFVIVLEDLEPNQAETQLTVALDRLYEAVRTPFDLGDGRQASIGMSLGVALFPIDGENGDSLIRQADAALYACKQNKLHRRRWWQLSHAQETLPQPDPGTPLEAYDPASTQLLARHQVMLEELAPAFVRQFYELLAFEPNAQSILSTLSATQMQRLVNTQIEHLRFLTDPATDRAALLARSEAVGQVHSLVGVNSALLIRSISLYRRLLIEHLGRTALSTRDRYRLMMVIESRVEDDLLAQAQAGSAVIQQYFGYLTRPLPPIGCLWNDALPQELAALHEIPGIRTVICLRRGDDAAPWVIEASQGSASDTVGHALLSPQNPQNSSAVRYHSQFNAALTSGHPHTVRNERWTFSTDTGEEAIHSALFLPIKDRQQLTAVVVGILGTHPHQFESVWAQQFARSSQLRLSQIWQICRSPALTLDYHLAEHYRQQLFEGGLRVYAQPIIELASARVVKVEALARLALPDGTILPPSAFIPLLGDAELDRLFQRVLQASLTALRAWDDQGLLLDLSVNLAPTTLRDAHCSDWVQQALDAQGIAPERLTLELLENDMGDSEEAHEAIHRLRLLGTPLAMDDLGAGYSSLKRLTRLPFASIKIDQALLARLPDNPVQTLSLISAIIQMGRDFNQQVVVEGLEDSGMIEAARILGAGYGQGYGIARPMPIDDIPDWIRQHPAEPPDTDAIRSPAGALAYHWLFMHQHLATYHGGNAEECPLHAFLRQQGNTATEALAWHAIIHKNPANTEVSRQLMNYLAGLI